MKLLQFIKSPAGNLVVFAGFATIGGLLIHRSNARDEARAAQLTKVEDVNSRPLRESIVRGGQPMKVPPPSTKASAEQRIVTRAPEAEVSRPRAARDAQAVKSEMKVKQETKPNVLPIS